MRLFLSILGYILFILGLYCIIGSLSMAISELSFKKIGTDTHFNIKILMKKFLTLIVTIFLLINNICYAIPLSIPLYENRLMPIIASASEAISYNYTYNDVGNRTNFTEPLGVHNYSYDNIDQLLEATHPILPRENFTYDALGNRNPLTNTYDTANRLLSIIASGSEAISYTYDANGNRITREDMDTGEITTYHYNAENQLTQVDLPDASTVNYYYDGLGRRIEKNVDGEITRYIYDGMDILAEYNSANELIRSYIHGPSIDEPLELTTGASAYYYISDGLGSITALVDSSGNIVEQYRYDAFGNVTILSSTGEEIPESDYGNSYMFTAREYDGETGLYYYRLRYYDPIVGRFLQEDPIGFAGGLNFYTYVGNNPINWVDPLGLWGEEDHIKAGGKDFRMKWGVDYGSQDRGATGPGWQSWRHFRDRESVEQGLKKDIERGDIKNFEGHMHQGQDTFVHYDKGYRWDDFGHLRSSILNKLLPDFIPEPDDPAFYEYEYDAMAKWTKFWEEQWGKSKCK